MLVVEDTPAVAALICRSLEADGLGVNLVTNLGDARSRLKTAVPDVVVLDVELPDGSGFDLLQEPVTAGVPVVIVSSHRSETDRVTGLQLGAQDYVVKPFFPRELAARVRLAAERSQIKRPEKLDFGDLVIDLGARAVVSHGATVELTDKEFDLLAHLAESPREVFHRDDLLRAVWQSSPEWQTPKTVTEHIRRVRQKVDADGQQSWITTVGRSGYRFEPR